MGYLPMSACTPLRLLSSTTLADTWHGRDGAVSGEANSADEAVQNDSLPPSALQNRTVWNRPQTGHSYKLHLVPASRPNWL